MVYMKSKEQPEDMFENLAAEILLGPTLMLVRPKYVDWSRGWDSVQASQVLHQQTGKYSLL